MQRLKRNSWLASLACAAILSGAGTAQTGLPKPAPDPIEPGLPRPIATAAPGAPGVANTIAPGSPGGAPVSPQTPQAVPAQPSGAIPGIPALPSMPPPMGTIGAAPGMMHPMAKPAARKKVSDMLLEELVQNALHHHTEILSAQSKLREAEMELIRVRQKILVQIATQRAEYEAAKAHYAEAKRRVDLDEQLFQNKAMSEADLSFSKLTALKLNAELTRAEAALAAAAAVAPPGYNEAVFQFYSSFDIGARTHATSTYPAVPSSVVPFSVPTIASTKTATASSKVMEKLAKALANPFKLDFAVVELDIVLGRLQQEGALDDLVVSLNREQLARKGDFVKLKNAVPLGAALQWVEDNYKVRFIVRDYGVTVTDVDRVPPGAIRVMDLWRQSNLSLQGGGLPAYEQPAGRNPSSFPSPSTPSPVR